MLSLQSYGCPGGICRSGCGVQGGPQERWEAQSFVVDRWCLPGEVSAPLGTGS